MRRSSYERSWGKQYDRPTLFDRFLGFVLTLTPPVSPVKTLNFRALAPLAQNEFMISFERAASTYRNRIEAAAGGNLKIENLNFDLGSVTIPGTYRLRDEAYANWLGELGRRAFRERHACHPPNDLDFLQRFEPPVRRQETHRGLAAPAHRT